MPMDRIILGENAEFSTDFRITGINNNVIVCGSSGCGKTMSISEPRLLNAYDSSLLVTVTKRRIVEKYKQLLSERGYHVMDLNFADPEHSGVSYDPLRFIGDYRDIIFLAETIVMSNRRKESTNADPFWDNSAISLLSAEIAYVCETKTNPSMSDVLEMNDLLRVIGMRQDGEGVVTSLNAEFDSLKARDPKSFAVRCWKTFAENPVRTARCVITTLSTILDTVFTPELRAIMKGQNKFDFRSLGRKRTVLFVTTSAVNVSMHRFVNIFYSQAIKALFEYAESLPTGELKVPVQIICDDFATGGRIAGFPEYISIFREKNISTVLLLQSESQLRSMYGDDAAKTIINNCDTYLYMGGMDIETSKAVSLRLNMPVDEVLSMPIGQEFIFRRGQRPIKTKRYDIEDNELYQSVTKKYEERIKEECIK